MSATRTSVVNGTIAVLLVLALLVVFLVDRGRSPAGTGVVIVEPKKTEAPPPSKPLRLAVTPRQYDDMGKLLAGLGSGFKYTNFPVDDLQDVSKLVEYDVLFLTCAAFPPEWMLGGDLGAGDRPGTHRARLNDEIIGRVREALRTFVGRGGTIYASDWRLQLIRLCFPELFAGQEIETGMAQSLTAEVVDPGLRDVLGSTVELKFELPGWFPAQFDDEKVTVYLRGPYRSTGGASTVVAPLLIKVPFEQGTIIFTSFHNERVNSVVADKLLRFLVFAAVTAKETAEAKKMMISGGFSPQKQNLLSASAETPKVTQTYANKKRGRLRFALGFANQGALLKLSVRGPDGRTYEQEGAYTFTVDVPDAAVGDWSYTVTAQKVPYPNFPFTLTVGGD